MNALPKRTPSSSPAPFTPHPAVAHLCSKELELQAETVELACAATATADELHAELVELYASTDPDDVEKISTVEGKFALAERIEAAAHARARRTTAAVVAAEGIAFRSPELVESIPARIVGYEAGLDEVRRKIEELKGVIRDLAYERNVAGRSIHSYLLGIEERRGNWSGTSRAGGITAEIETALATVENECAKFPYTAVIAKSIVGEAGLDRVPGLPVPADELPPEVVQGVRAMLPVTSPKLNRWLRGEDPHGRPTTTKVTRKTTKKTEESGDAAA